MRVTCQSLVEFCSNVQFSGSGKVLQRVIRFAIMERKISEVHYEITCHLSAVVGLDSGGEYLLEAPIFCGRDVRDSTKKKDGTENAKHIEKLLEEFCSQQNLRTLPGVTGI